MTWAEHDRILGNLRAPQALVSTKPNAASEPGESPDPRHHYWVMRTADPALVLNCDWPLDFAQPVAEGLLLTDAPTDLLTTKLAVIEALRGQYVSLESGQQLQSLAYHICWIVRWREALGIAKMQDITPALFDAFCDSLGRGGFASLIPLGDRLRRLEERVRSGEWTWPIRKDIPRPDYKAICAALGVPLQTFHDPSIRSQVRALIQETAPDLQPTGEDDDEPAEGRRLAAGSVTHILRSWRTLHHLSALGVLPDPLTFAPFDRVDLAARTRQIASMAINEEEEEKTGGRTATLGPEQWLGLLDGAARWVLDYAKPIMTICKAAHAEQIKVFGENPSKPQRKNGKKIDCWRAAVQSIIDEHLPVGRPGVPHLVAMWRRPGKQVTAAGRRRRKNAVEVDKNGMFLDEAVTHVVTACLTLITGFSARRATEVGSLRAGCAYQDPRGTGQWLMTSYIAKTVRNTTEIPIPASVAHAVQLLEEISQPTRECDETAWLTRIYRPGLLPGDNHSGERSFLKTRLKLTLNDFAEVVGVRRPEHGDDWDFKPHQLRRAFSIYYYHGYRYSSLDALSRFLRHWDPEMTLRYVTETMHGAMARLREIAEGRSEDADESERSAARAASKSLFEWGREHADVREDHLVGRMLEVYDGNEAPIGQGAAALISELEELVEDARRSIRVAGPSNICPDQEREALAQKLRRIAPRRYLEPHPGGHAHCRCDPHDPSQTAKARCLQNRHRETGADSLGWPDFAYASIADCYECDFCVAFSENVRVVKRRIIEAEDAVAKAPRKAFKTAAEARLATYRAQLSAARDAVQNRRSFGV